MFSLYSLFKRSPLKLPPKYILYLPGALPINAISANAGRAHPLGQPVIRIVISSSLTPASSNKSSILDNSVGK